jgi:3-phenylpropionate/cinnamic acid dioxygenase small subunit
LRRIAAGMNGAGGPHNVIPGVVTVEPVTSDQNPRACYKRWADLLDEREYDQWLDLLTEDIVYWMPMRKNVSWHNRNQDITPENDMAWIHDDKDTLRKRVKQIQTGIHWADEPLSRVAHVITNIRLAEFRTSLGDGEQALTKCRFIVYRNRVEDETDLLVGRREDTLLRTGGQLKLSRRKIILDQSVLLAKNLTMFF